MDKGEVDSIVKWMRHTAFMTEVYAEEAYLKHIKGEKDVLC